MKWKYKDARVIIKMDENARMIHGVLKGNSNIFVQPHIVESLEGKLNIPVLGNIELVMLLVGLRRPPNQWCKII